MSDIFLMNDASALLGKKHIIFFGDSNMRSLYKDFIWLINRNSLTGKDSLKRKLENSFLGDTLVKSSELHKGRDFEEVRKYEKGNVHLEYFFITRCYNSNIESMMSAIKEKKRDAPHVIIMNSCLWDITRWGPNGVTAYKDNMMILMKLFKRSLPPETLVIWTTAPPVSPSCSGALLVKQVEFLQHSLRFEVMEANMFARDVVVAHGFDVVDIHHHLRMQIHRRATDGIHWLPGPVRHMTNLLLTHIALSWDSPLPGHFKSPFLDSIKNHKDEKTDTGFPSRPTSPMNIKLSVPDSSTAFKALTALAEKNTFQLPTVLPKKKKARRGRALLPKPLPRKENVSPCPQAADAMYNNYGELVNPLVVPLVVPLLDPWKHVVMYNNYGEPVYMSQSFYHKINRRWRQSFFHRQQRKVTPYHF